MNTLRHDSLVLRQTSTLQALFPADNGFDLDRIVVQDHDRFYLREQPKCPAKPESHSQIISDSEDEAHSLPCSAYTLGSDDTSSEHHVATNQHASSFPQIRCKQVNSRAVGPSCSPDAVFRTNAGRQNLPAQQSGSLNAVAAPASTHQYSVDSRQVTSSLHSGSEDTAALRHKPSRMATAVQQPGVPHCAPALISHQSIKARSPSANRDASVATVPATGSHQRSRAQTSLPVDSAQRSANAARLNTPDLPCHSRPEVQQSGAQTDSMHGSEQATGQAEAQSDGNRSPTQQAGASQRNTAGSDVSLYACAVLAGACKHASLSLAAQMGFTSAYALFASQQRSEDKTTAVDREQKAEVLQDSICATAVDSRLPAAEEAFLDTDATAVTLKQHPAACTALVLSAKSAVALSDGDAQVLNKPEVDAQRAEQNAVASNDQVCHCATS